MFLSKRNGVYYLFYHDERGVRHKVSTKSKTKGKALRFLQSYQPPSIKPESHALSLPEFFQQLEDYLLSTHQPGTVGIYKKAWKHLETVAGAVRLDQLSAIHFDRFKAYRLRDVSPVTVNIDLRALKAALGLAVRWEILSSNPFSKLSLVSIPSVSPVFFSKEQLQLLLSSIKERWLHDFVLLAGATGMRRGEIVNLRWSQVDLENGFIRIEGDKNFRTKAGGKRVIPMSQIVRALLSEIRSRGTGEYVFSRNGSRLSGHYVSRKFKKCLSDLSMPVELHLHGLRHAFARSLALDGVSIYHISKLLGHSTVGVTEKFYANIQPEELRESVERLRLVVNQN